MERFRATQTREPFLTKGKLYEYFYDTVYCNAEFSADNGNKVWISYPFDPEYAIKYSEIPKRITVL